MRAYYLTGFAAFAALGQLAACGGSERSFSDETGGTGGNAAGSGGSAAGNGGSSAGNGGSSAGNGGSSAGNGGSSAGNGGSSAGNGGSSAGSGGSSAGNGGSSAGSGGSSAGAGGSAAGSGGAAGTGATGGAGGSGGTAGAGGGTQTVQCDEDNANPSNSSDVIADVTITYDPGTMMWSAPAACDWNCNANYCEDTGQCLNSKQVACDPDNSNPANSADISGDVTVTCAGTAFSDPSKCLWMCNSGYCQEANSCLTSKTSQCDANNGNPANSSDVITSVNVSCGAGGVWGSPAACAWNCNSGYCIEGNSCLSSKSVQCNTNNGNPANSTDVVANVSVSCTGGGWPSAPACAWNCNAGYVKNAAGNACVRPIYMFDGGGVSGALGGRSSADTLCRNTRSSSYASLPSTRVRAFISVTSTDEIRDMPSNYGYSTAVPLLGPTGTKLADDWADLLDGSLDTTLSGAGVTSGFWYSGSNFNGSIAAETCTSWTSPNGFLDGRYGRGVFTTPEWIQTGNATCGSSGYHVLCLASL